MHTDHSSHVETVALLSKLNTEHHLDIEIAEDELSEIDFSKDATYREIKKYVLDKYGLKVSSLYIAQVKRKSLLQSTRLLMPVLNLAARKHSLKLLSQELTKWKIS